LLVPGLEVLETWENPIKLYGYWHFGHGDFNLHNEPNVYLALVLLFSPQLLGPYQHDQGSWELLCTQFMAVVDSTKVLNKPQSMPDPLRSLRQCNYSKYILLQNNHVKFVLLFVYFIVQLYKQLVFDHTLMRKGSVGHSCRAIGSKILSCGMVHQGISRRVLRGATYDPDDPGH
jgi:hypothetical protein